MYTIKVNGPNSLQWNGNFYQFSVNFVPTNVIFLQRGTARKPTFSNYMNIITFTTDLGTEDHYSGVLKARLLQRIQDVFFVDITHQIDPFDVQQAAHVLGAACFAFPPGTVHVAVVAVENANGHRCIFFEKNGHYFAGPDNGVFPLALGELPRDIFTIPLSGAVMEDIATAAAGMAAGNPLPEIGVVTGNVKLLQKLQMPVMDDLIKTSVVYIDRFGNVVCGITIDDFETARRERSFSIEFGKRESIVQILQSYSDVPPGERLCLFNDSGFLEIAVNQGNAHELLALNINDVILIEFT